MSDIFSGLSSEKETRLKNVVLHHMKKINSTFEKFDGYAKFCDDKVIPDCSRMLRDMKYMKESIYGIGIDTKPLDNLGYKSAMKILENIVDPRDRLGRKKKVETYYSYLHYTGEIKKFNPEWRKVSSVIVQTLDIEKELFENDKVELNVESVVEKKNSQDYKIYAVKLRADILQLFADKDELSLEDFRDPIEKYSYILMESDMSDDDKKLLTNVTDDVTQLKGSTVITKYDATGSKLNQLLRILERYSEN